MSGGGQVPGTAARRVAGTARDGRTRVVGIVNVTPDSLWDGGRHLDAAAAISHGEALVAAGADLLDIGGESTRPGHTPVPPQVQIERVVPVLEGLAARVDVPLSIDTTWSPVARAALAAGATWINDTMALGDDVGLADLAAREGAVLVLMHRFQPPRQPDQQPRPGRALVRLVAERLRERVALALAHGVPRENLVVDPGIGFGTLPDDALAMHVYVDELRALGLPLLFGTSRKSFLGHVTGREVGERGAATAASVAWLARAGVEYLRVHDVGATRDVVAVVDALRAMEGSP